MCGQEVAGGWIPGRCQACKGRRRGDAIRPFLIANNIEPGDIKWWSRSKDGKPVFIAHQLFKEKTEGTK